MVKFGRGSVGLERFEIQIGQDFEMFHIRGAKGEVFLSCGGGDEGIAGSDAIGLRKLVYVYGCSVSDIFTERDDFEFKVI